MPMSSYLYNIGPPFLLKQVCYSDSNFIYLKENVHFSDANPKTGRFFKLVC